jgi:hypothetical protein
MPDTLEAPGVQEDDRPSAVEFLSKRKKASSEEKPDAMDFLKHRNDPQNVINRKVLPQIFRIYGALTSPAVAEASEMGREQIKAEANRKADPELVLGQAKSSSAPSSLAPVQIGEPLTQAMPVAKSVSAPPTMPDFQPPTAAEIQKSNAEAGKVLQGIGKVLHLPVKAGGAVLADILNRGRMESAIEGTGTVEPRFGESPEERAQRLKFAGTKPLLTPQGTSIDPEGTDAARLLSQFSTPEQIAMPLVAKTKLGGKLIMTEILAQLPAQIQEAVEGGGTDTEKRDKINNLFALGAMVAHGAAKRPPGREWQGPLATEAGRLEMGQHIAPPPPITGEVLPMPDGAMPFTPPETETGPRNPELPAAPVEPGRGWTDFVDELKRRGTGTETRAQIQGMFPALQMSKEAAGRLAEEAFGDKWDPGGEKPQPTPTGEQTAAQAVANSLKGADMETGGAEATPDAIALAQKLMAGMGKKKAKTPSTATPKETNEWSVKSGATGDGILPEQRVTRKPGDRVRSKDGKTGTILQELSSGQLEVEWKDGTKSTVNQSEVSRSQTVSVEVRNRISVGRVGKSWVVTSEDANGGLKTISKHPFERGYGTEEEARAAAVESAASHAQKNGFAGFFEQTGPGSEKWTESQKPTAPASKPPEAPPAALELLEPDELSSRAPKMLQRAVVLKAVAEDKPINATLFEQTFSKSPYRDDSPTPTGYVREGDRYVFKGETPVTLSLDVMKAALQDMEPDVRKAFAKFGAGKELTKAESDLMDLFARENPKLHEQLMKHYGEPLFWSSILPPEEGEGWKGPPTPAPPAPPIPKSGLERLRSRVKQTIPEPKSTTAPTISENPVVDKRTQTEGGVEVQKPDGETGGTKTSNYLGYTIESTPQAVQVGYSTPTKLFGKGRRVGGFNVTDPEGYARHFDTLKEAKAWIDNNPVSPPTPAPTETGAEGKAVAPKPPPAATGEAGKKVEAVTPVPPVLKTEDGAEGTMPTNQSLGGALAGENLGSGGDYVSNMFAAIDRDRVAMGKEPMEPGNPRTWSQDDALALGRMNKDPEWVPNLIKEVTKKPRPLRSDEKAGMDWQKAKWKAEYNGALSRMATAFDDIESLPEGEAKSSRRAEYESAHVQSSVLEDKLVELEKAVGRGGTGSEAGRTLQAQKRGITDELTVVEMTLQKRAANGFRRLTEEETKRIQEDVKRLTEINKATQQALTDAEAKVFKAEADRAMAELKASQQTIPPYIIKVAEQIGKKIHTEAEAARERIKARLGKVTFGSGPLQEIPNIKDYAIIGADHIYTVGLDAVKWSAKMVEEFGDGIKPHLTAIFEESKKQVERIAGVSKATVTRVIKTKTDTESVKDSVTDAIKENLANKEKSKITWQINKLAKELYKGGIRDREEMVDALHEVVGAATGMSRREVAEAFAGYGNFRQLPKTQMAVDIRGMKGELQQLAKLEAMQRGEPPLKSGVERRTPTDTERKLIKKVNDAKNKFQIPIENPETQLKSALDTLKTTLKNRIEDYKDRITRKDYAPHPRREVLMDSAATRLKAEEQRIKKRWRDDLLADQMKNRTPWEKVLDWGAKYRRFTALSSPMVIPKLVGAAGWRALSTVAEDVSGGALSLIPGIRQISQRAPLEGAGGQMRATMRGFGAAFTQGMVDAVNVLKRGGSDIDALYGKSGESYTGESEMASLILQYPGRSHGAIKAPVKRGAFEKANTRLQDWHERTAQRLGEWYAQQEFPVASDALKYRIALDSYKYGNRAIFLQDNRVASAFNSALATLERNGESGHPSIGGKVLATAARFMFPVTKVPTNIAAETLQYATGSVSGSVRAANAIRKGLDTLTPDQADLIMRELKKGSIGFAALILGYCGYQSIGGVYEQGKKKKPGDIKPGGVRMFGEDIPANLLHHPVLNTIQLGAVIHKTADEKLRKKDTTTQGLTAGLLAATWGLADEVPFVEGPHRLFGGLANRYTRQETVGNQARSVAIPEVMNWTAKVLDGRRETPPANLYQRVTGPPAPLKPKGIWQNIETGIPGLRGRVPTKAATTNTQSASQPYNPFAGAYNPFRASGK